MAKPGIRTSEFWFTALAQAIGGTLQAVHISEPDGIWGIVAGAALQALTIFGYQNSRSKVKGKVK